MKGPRAWRRAARLQVALTPPTGSGMNITTHLNADDFLALMQAVCEYEET
jgi:hypothetical protein